MPRISFAMSVCCLTLCLAAGMTGGARADEERRAYATPQPSPYPTVNAPTTPSQQPPSRPHPAGNAARMHPEACASLCRVFEFLGALERPTPPKPIPTS